MSAVVLLIAVLTGSSFGAEKTGAVISRGAGSPPAGRCNMESCTLPHGGGGSA